MAEMLTGFTKHEVRALFDYYIGLEQFQRGKHRTRADLFIDLKTDSRQPTGTVSPGRTVSNKISY